MISISEIFALFNNDTKLTLAEVVAITAVNVIFFFLCFSLLLFVENRRYRKQVRTKSEVIHALRPKIIDFVERHGVHMTEEEKINLVIDLMANELMKYNWTFNNSFAFENYNSDELYLDRLLSGDCESFRSNHSFA